MNGTGFVSLVGAGPGDPGLLTIAGRDRLERADVVVYDRLVSPEVVAFSHRTAEMVFAGKEPGRHALTQDQINALLVEKARSGKRVVRLKGGDPFVFGRGGEEALALAAARISFEVVPGVTSAVAAPAYAGVPVTHRGLASSFAIITGHEDDEKDEGTVDWRRLATGVDTIVVLMGGAALESISRALIEGGRAATTPAVSIQWGTTARQRSIAAPLSEIATAARDAGLGTPLLTVIGDVAGLRDEIAWFESRPLFGKTVLVTRASHQAGALSGLLRDRGARVVELPVLEIVPLSIDPRPLTNDLFAGLYDWCVFTSVNAIEAFWVQINVAGLDARIFHCSIAVIGSGTAAALQSHSLSPNVVGRSSTSEGLVEELVARGMAGKSVLIPTAASSRDILAAGLRSAGAAVTEVAVYESRVPTRFNREALAALRAGEIDAVTFASSSAVRNLTTVLESDISLLRHSTIACIGPITAETARQYGLEVAIEPETHTVAALVEALAQHFGGRHAHQSTASTGPL